jgi:hypothetical protein
MVIEPQTIDQINDLSANSKQQAKELRRKVEEAEETVQLWIRLTEFVKKRWPAHIVDLLNKRDTQLKRLYGDPQIIENILGDLRHKAKEAIEPYRRQFPRLLDQACKEASLEIHLDSRHPRYYFSNKFIVLDIDDQKILARISNHEGRLENFPADIGAIVEGVVREQKRLFDRDFEGEKFLDRIRKQYLAIIKRDNLEDGDGIPIRAITGRLGKNLKGFRTDEFLIDLSRLTEDGPLEVDGRRLDLQQTKDTKKGMLLYGQMGRGYIGFVVFRKVGS